MYVLDAQKNHLIETLLLSTHNICFNICFGCSKEQYHSDGSFEYQQHMFWLRNNEIKIFVTHSKLKSFKIEKSIPQDHNLSSFNKANNSK